MNRPHWVQLSPHDILKLDPRRVRSELGLRPRELGVIAAGPPCQPFSKAAQWSPRARTGMNDERSHCVHALIELVGELLPRVLLIENVPGFARGGVSASSVISRGLARVNSRSGAKYDLQWRTLNAVDYGVPQRRERAVMVAIRDGSKFRWPSPTCRSNPVRAWDALAGVRVASVPQTRGRWADLLPSIPEGHNYLWHTDRGGGRNLFGYRTRYWSFLLKLSKGEPAWTLPASPAQNAGPFHWDNRPLAVEEMLRLQSFPDAPCSRALSSL